MDRIENDASNNSSLPREPLYRAIVQQRKEGRDALYRAFA
jgi:hypothetical protein